MNGFLLIDKNENMTSFDVVKEVKKKLQIKKVGHSGTLDPMTTGILVIAIGRATKYLPILMDGSEKEYQACAKFGIETDTGDIFGETLNTDDNIDVSLNEFIKLTENFTGKYDQYPPMYSAKKINGKRLYEYAREGKEIEIKPSEVEIIKYANISQLKKNEFEFSVEVSKGTYIRSLIVDMGHEINSCATMTKLRRKKTDGFNVKDAYKLSDVNEDKILDLDVFLKQKYNTFVVDGKIEKMVCNGVELKKMDNQSYPLAYISKETQKVIALYDIKNEERTKPIFMIGK